jgi:hypothetical protein
MRTLDLILYVVAALCFLVAASNKVSADKINLVALGLLAWVLVPLITLARNN